MVEATVVMKNGERQTVVVNDFNELFERYKDQEVAAVSGKLIHTKDMRQGRYDGGSFTKLTKQSLKRLIGKPGKSTTWNALMPCKWSAAGNLRALPVGLRT